MLEEEYGRKEKKLEEEYRGKLEEVRRREENSVKFYVKC